MTKLLSKGQLYRILFPSIIKQEASALFNTGGNSGKAFHLNIEEQCDRIGYPQQTNFPYPNHIKQANIYL